MTSKSGHIGQTLSASFFFLVSLELKTLVEVLVKVFSHARWEQRSSVFTRYVPCKRRKEGWVDQWCEQGTKIGVPRE